MLYETYILMADCQLPLDTATHPSYQAGLEAWKNNCQRLLAGHCAQSVLHDASGEELVWTEGAAASGKIAEAVLCGCQPEEIDTPEKVVAKLLELLG